MTKLYIFSLLLFISFANAQVINFPDPLFEAKLLTTNGTGQQGNVFAIDANGNGSIEESEALAVYDLTIGADDISDFSGIEYFSNLTALSIYDNPITAIDVSSLSNLITFRLHFTNITSVILSPSIEELRITGNELLTSFDPSDCPALKVLDCGYNALMSLDVTGNIDLEVLLSDQNDLSSLNVQGLTNLVQLNCNVNELTTLDVSTLTNLQELHCDQNQISQLNIANLPLLQSLRCSHNQISNLDIAGKAFLNDFRCSYNAIESLDFTGVNSTPDTNFVFVIDLRGNNLQTVDFTVMGDTRILAECSFNPNLTMISIKNGHLLTDQFGIGLPSSLIPPPLPEAGLYIAGTPNLQYVCTDEYNIPYVQAKIALNEYECVVNSYCTFVPGEAFYITQGTVRFDSEGDGCDNSDANMAGLQIAISDGTESRSYFTNATGNYMTTAFAGSHTISPVFENPEYFTVSPASIVVDFPATASPSTADFCISANGVHPDVEVVLLPLNVARPGFDSQYRLLYRNKGNQVQNGYVSVDFDDLRTDFISAIPTATDNNGAITWLFESLMPFESREITFTLNINSPNDSVPVNLGDILTMTGNIISGADIFNEDNTMTINQVVQNSLDPNDKTCLEGEVVLPTAVGEFVHYLIRFENEGTYAAENVVVKDIIDASTFDISTLLPLSSSHSFETRISSGNNVEFIFENINLPFDEGNNDGYVAFKIRTMPTLAVGDSFSNTASIYFDYNIPIVTNTATTTIAALGADDFNFGNYFTLYPVPTSKVLNIQMQSGIQVKSINIYNLLGQLVLEMPHAENIEVIDTSYLESGSYFIKIKTDKGSSSASFIKQ
ncbi:MAG TPA: T9SS type A sorting domain-containing protein [Flavobacterium sp.]